MFNYLNVNRFSTFRFGFVRNIISFSSEKVLLSGVAYTIILIYIICLILTYLVGETLLAQSYLLWEAFFLFIILVINFIVAFNEEYVYRNEISIRVTKVLGKYKSYPIIVIYFKNFIWHVFLIDFKCVYILSFRYFKWCH